MDYLKTRELYHHGIKGMKWGVRNYQNEDGTLTEEGKMRYQAEPGYSSAKIEANNEKYKIRREANNEKYKTRQKRRVAFKAIAATVVIAKLASKVFNNFNKNKNNAAKELTKSVTNNIGSKNFAKVIDSSGKTIGRTPFTVLAR